MVRVDCKFKPTHSRVGVPQDMQDYKKTTMVKDLRSGKWDIFENRVAADEVNDFDKDTAAACLIFLQEPRYWKDFRIRKTSNVALNARIDLTAGDMLLDENTKVTTMNQEAEANHHEWSCHPRFAG